MSDILKAIIPAIIIIVVTVCFRMVLKKDAQEMRKMNRVNFVIRSPKFYKIVGLVDLVLFGGLIIMFLLTGNETADAFVFTVFSVFAALGLFILLYAVRCRITVEDERISVVSMFKPKRDFSVKDITHIKASPNLGVRVYSGSKKLFSVDTYAVGCGMFVSYLIEQGVQTPDIINLPRY